MTRPLIEQLTDTRVFRALLVLSAIVTLPVIAAGLATLTPGLLLFVAWNSGDYGSLGVALLPLGGAIGLVGWARAHWGARDPGGHNVTATLLCLIVGIATALIVGGFSAFIALTAGVGEASPWLGGFAVAHAVWVLSGIAWMQRLTRSYAEHIGTAFDAIPVTLLSVTIALSLSVVLIALAL